MSSDWIFVSRGMQIGLGLKTKAKNGTLGITSLRELLLYGDNGEVIDRAPIAQIIFKFSINHKLPLMIKRYHYK